MTSPTDQTHDVSAASVRRSTVGALFEVARPHHAAKNALIFLPLLASHRYVEPALLGNALLAFVSFSCVAAATYIVNDARDIDADRLHATKRNRVFASGRASLQAGLMFAAVLAICGLVAASRLPVAFGGWLAVYVLVTLAYTFGLKRVVILDVMIIAGLFSLRVLAGGAATGIVPSFWLLAFSMFVFLSIALVKRVTELRAQPNTATAQIPGRGYRPDDQWALAAMGIASGFVAVLIVALYVNSPDVRVLYRMPDLIWLTCPIGLFVIARLWLLGLRGEVNEDPVIFLLRDRASQMAVAVAGAVAWFAR
jgi:4-hydroxybenzoate polyprenyltransferase